jgi:DNA-binding MarR family transcriptional regulator
MGMKFGERETKILLCFYDEKPLWFKQITSMLDFSDNTTNIILQKMLSENIVVKTKAKKYDTRRVYYELTHKGKELLNHSNYIAKIIGYKLTLCEKRLESKNYKTQCKC